MLKRIGPLQLLEIGQRVRVKNKICQVTSASIVRASNGGMIAVHHVKHLETITTTFGVTKIKAAVPKTVAVNYSEIQTFDNYGDFQ